MASDTKKKWNFLAGLTAKDLTATGKTGATATPIVIAGGTAAGAPTSGAHLKGEVVYDDTGAGWYCTVAGTPGTWAPMTPRLGNGSSLPALPSALWPRGSQYFDNDLNGGTLFVVNDAGTAWTQVAPGVTEFGGVLLQRAENLTDVTCTSGTTPVSIPNLSFSVTKRAGRSLTIRWGGRVYNATGGSGGVLQLFEDGVLLEDGCGWTSSVAFAFYYNTSEIVRDAISAGSHTYTVKLLALMNAAPGTAHAWGATAGTLSGSPRGRSATFLAVYES